MNPEEIFKALQIGAMTPEDAEKELLKKLPTLPAQDSLNEMNAQKGVFFDEFQSVNLKPELLGNPVFQQRYCCRLNYYAGSMGRGIASEELVTAMGNSSLLSFFGSAGLGVREIEAHIRSLKSELGQDKPYGMCLISNLDNIEEERERVELFLKYQVPVVEASAYAQLSWPLVYYRIKGLVQHGNNIVIPRRIIGKCSRLEVARLFLSPPPVNMIHHLLALGLINEEEARLSQYIPMADDLAVEADSGGHTDQGVSFSLIPSIISAKEDLQRQYQYQEEILIGCGGGIGTPEAVAAAFALGADFIFTGSINQCTVESGAHPVVKDLLNTVSIHDTAITIAGDMFEVGAKAQVVKKNTQVHARANHLYKLYLNYHSLDEIPPEIKKQLENLYFKKTLSEVWAEVYEYKNGKNPEQIKEAEENPRYKMALIFKWYFAHCNQVTRNGDESEQDNFLIPCGPAMGAFNQWVKGTRHEHWQNRHVDEIAELLMMKACDYIRTKQFFGDMSDDSTKTVPVSEEKNLASDYDQSAIAIIGMSGQFPKANTLTKFWDNLSVGMDCISEIPSTRWAIDDYYDPDLTTPAKTNCKWLGVLEDVDLFDPLFFKTSPTEAELMDPQQRLFLENSWHCIEDAGLNPTRLSESRCGVFVGCGPGDYRQHTPEDELTAQGYMGSSMAILSARIAYFLNLKGPNLAIDTACSSSLVAIAEACNNLVLRTCDLALAGGVNLFLSPAGFITNTKSGMLSKDGRCFSFDTRANGYVPGEGVGVILLKRLEDAVRDGDPIHGVIRGWGVNQDGKTNGITAPSVNSQIRLEKEVYQRFGINPESISMVEAHGTGTKLGDPIEVEALTESFRSFTDKNNYCALGSVKSNIGHLIKAAGIAGVIKVLLAMRHRKLPPTIHFNALNEHITLDNSPFYINTELKPWEVPEGMPRRASVSSFGFSGTNAHIVIEEYRKEKESSVTVPDNETPDQPFLFVLSAASKEQLKTYARLMNEFIESNETLNLADLAYTLQVGRSAMDFRLVVLANSKGDLLKAFDDFIEDQASGNVRFNQVKKKKDVTTILQHDIEKRDYRKISELWVEGLDIDWNQLYRIHDRPSRISIPTYPFARERYWLPENIMRTDHTATLSATSIIHPLLHQNTSSLFEQRFTSTFTGREFFLNDHVVKGRCVLPGVAYLEMARAAIEQAMEESKQTTLCLKNIIWARPVIVDNERFPLHIGLSPNDNGEIAYEIYSESNGENNEPIIHNQGVAVWNRGVEGLTLNLKELQSECSQHILTQDQCYDAYKRMGIEYGIGHKGIEKVYVGTEQVLAKLSLPTSLSKTEEQYVLHPSIMDSALQASIGLTLNKEDLDKNNSLKLALPFALQEIEIFDKCTSNMWAFIRRSKGRSSVDKLEKLDVDLCDDTGRVNVRIKALTSRFVEGELGATGSMDSNGTLLLHPTWKEQIIPSSAEKSKIGDYTHHLVILCELSKQYQESIETQMRRVMPGIRCLIMQSSYQELDKRFIVYAIQLFEEIYHLFKEKPKGKMLIQIVASNRKEQQVFSGLAGLIRTAHLENPNLTGQVIEVASEEDAEGLVEKLLENSRTPSDLRIRYQDGRRLVQGWNECETRQEEDHIPWKNGGIYLITGGTGGLGLIFAKEIAKRVKSATLILTGRSPLSDIKQAKLKEISGLDIRIEYRQVDVADHKAVTELIENIRECFGGLDGIIHSAGVIKDNFIIKKTKDEFMEVLAPKVTGLVNLDQASKDLHLDFFILFSAIAGTIGNVGQADYATANAFMDGYAHYRNELVQLKQRRGKTLSVNWPLWQDGGMSVDQEREELMVQNTGMMAMRTKTGIQALYQSMASGKGQIMVMEGHVAKMRQILLEIKPASVQSISGLAEQQQSEKAPNNLQNQVKTDLIRMAAELLQVNPANIDASVALTEYGFDPITVAEFSNRLNDEYSFDVAPTLFFDYSTLHLMTDYLIEKYGDILIKRYRIENASMASSTEDSPRAVTAGEEFLHEKTVNYLKKILSSVIKLPVNRIEADAELEKYGIDSIMVMQLTNQLEKVFGSLSKTLFFEYQNIQELAGYFLEMHREQLQNLLGIEEKVTTTMVPNEDSGMNSVRVAPKNHRRNRFASFTESPAGSPAEKGNEASDIAIIGVSGRYPGARNLQEFWSNLREGRDSIIEIPKERWDSALYFDEDKTKFGKAYSKWGGFLEGVDQFDPLFFNISPREAERMDPQERLFLECAYAAMEDAGYTRETLGSYRGLGLEGNVGVYVGVMYEEYQLYGAQEQQRGRPVTSGGSLASIANRVSYFFNFHGPSMAVETMCSSSLTAIHLACQSLQRDGCELAIAGGVNVSIHPNKYLKLSQGKFISSKGRCESFGEGGDGYVPGEGVGAVLLKPLSKAIEDGDQIYGVIKGTAINHGGKTNGYTVPSPNAQGSLIGQALKEAGVNPRTISYLEAHGTGTVLGDPIEITGLTRAFGKDTADRQFCAIGSVKSNIGHCEGAAGIAGLTKVLLQFKNGQIAPSLHSKMLNPNIDFKETPFVVQQELTEWKRPRIETNGEVKEYPRRAGVSSFGAGGANAHVIIEEYISDERESSEYAVSPDHPAMIVLSAKSEERLEAQVRQLLGAIQEQAFTEKEVIDIAYTLQVGREAMEERLAVIVSSLKELQDKLTGFLEGKDDIEDLYRGQVKRNKETMAVLTADEDMIHTIDAWISKRKYGKLLDVWVKGLNVDWNRLYPGVKPHRISLPTYPFARERYWVPDSETGIASLTAAIAGTVIHPLVQQNTSDLTEQRFSTTLTGQEFFLTDHVVNGQRVLPGVAYLEMARAAVAEATREKDGAVIRLKNVVWSQPIVVGEQPLRVHIGLYPEDDGEIAYEIYREDEADPGESVVYSQGRATLSPATGKPALNLKALQEECHQGRLTSEVVYEAFRAMGIEYGPGHQGIEQVYRGEEQVLAELSLPMSVRDTEEQYVLHPGIMDAALQASLGLRMGSEDRRAALPFALREIEIISPCTPKMWAWIRNSSNSQAGDQVRKLDLDLCDEQGNVCIRMKELSSRVLGGEVSSLETQAAPGLLMLEPIWEEQEITRQSPGIAAYAQHLIILCELSNVASEVLEERMKGVRCVSLQSPQSGIAERFQSYAARVFEEIQSLLKEKPKQEVWIQIAVPNEGEQELFTGLLGLLKTAQIENPKLHGQLIEVEADEEADRLQEILETGSGSSERHIRYQAGKHLVARWKEIEVQPEAIDLPWKDQGVYLITGGLGGLGLLMAEEIAHRVQGAVLVLTGRSALNEARQAQLKELEQLGAHIEYRQVDVTDKQAVTAFIRSLQEEFGRIHGIIHSAGVIKDNFIIKKTKEEFVEVLAPKVAGLENLDQASQDVGLDFFILFSSLTGRLGNIGQADYATANAFMDAYAHYRNLLVAGGQRQGRTISINWPLWQAGGMSVDQEREQLMRQNTGMIPMQTETGIRALYQSLASRREQVMVMEGNLQQFRVNLLKPFNSKEEINNNKTVAKSIAIGEAIGEEFLHEKTVNYLKKILSSVIKLPVNRIEADAELEKYGIDSIMVMQLTNQLEKVFGSLSKTLFFEYQNIQELAGYFLEMHREQLQNLLGIEEKVPTTMIPDEDSGMNSVRVAPKNHRRNRFASFTGSPAGSPAEKGNEASDIAIIGVSGRYPGARNLQEFWSNLREGQDSIIEIPKERWDSALYFDEDKTKFGKAYSKWGGFLEGVDQFDPLFFNISPREAERMDPQERL
ncbi:PfaD family polyunsaturated fatty acid/polyketide biosynthesis protein, partial [Paenibacillus sp. HN-1]